MDTSFELSTYQKNILDYVENENGNLLVDAKAGSGKTSTLILISNELVKQNKRCLFLAFNKSIVEELRTKIINPNCEIKTIHSLGLSFIRSYLYRKHNTKYELEISDKQLKETVRYYYGKICSDIFVARNKDMDNDELKSVQNKIITDLVSMVNFTRFYNVNYHKDGSTDWLMNKCCWYLPRYKDSLPKYQQVIESTIDDIKYRFENPETVEGIPHYIIDYTDMVYFPIYYNMYVPYSVKPFLDVIMVDESQDLNVMQQKFLQRLNNGNSRYIFVGDAYQSIYGFAGADTHSIYNIKRNFVLNQLPLNICYRCPKNVVKLAQGIVNDIEWNKDREDEGTVEFIEREELEQMLKPKDILIGRKNKDLVDIFLDLALKKQVKVKFVNKALVNSVVTELECTIKDYIRYYNKGLNIDKELEKELSKYRIVNNLQDEKEAEKDKGYKVIKQKYKSELIQKNLDSKKFISKSNQNLDYLKKCMEEYKDKGSYYSILNTNMAEYYDTILNFMKEYKKEHSSILVKNFIIYIKEFLSSTLDDNVPVISSIHGMKGGEGDNIFILDYPRFPYNFNNSNDDDKQQESNLQYVALTRAKKSLYLVKIEEKEEDDFEINNKCICKVNKLLSGVNKVEDGEECNEDEDIYVL